MLSFNLLCVFWLWVECLLLQTPKDKVKCVFRCATTIMNLLSMANEKAVPAADDFIPVIIFVIIKANPPCLLSTIQYIQSFYGNRIGGEEQYWWIQFCSAVEFIKNMDYTNEWPRSIISLQWVMVVYFNFTAFWLVFLCLFVFINALKLFWGYLDTISFPLISWWMTTGTFCFWLADSASVCYV